MSESKVPSENTDSNPLKKQRNVKLRSRQSDCCSASKRSSCEELTIEGVLESPKRQRMSPTEMMSKNFVKDLDLPSFIDEPFSVSSSIFDESISLNNAMALPANLSLKEDELSLLSGPDAQILLKMLKDKAPKGSGSKEVELSTDLCEEDFNDLDASSTQNANIENSVGNTNLENQTTCSVAGSKLPPRRPVCGTKRPMVSDQNALKCKARPQLILPKRDPAIKVMKPLNCCWSSTNCKPPEDSSSVITQKCNTCQSCGECNSCPRSSNQQVKQTHSLVKDVTLLSVPGGHTSSEEYLELCAASSSILGESQDSNISSQLSNSSSWSTSSSEFPCSPLDSNNNPPSFAVNIPTPLQLNNFVTGIPGLNDDLESDSDSCRHAHNAKERVRRARIKQACEDLKELVPGLGTRTDKATVLEFGVHYIRFMKYIIGGHLDQEFSKRMPCNNS